MNTSQGMTLQESLQQQSPIEPVLAAKIGLQIAQQLAASRDIHIVHPGRIHLTKEGVARLLPAAAEELALPAIVEYPAYASPEEIQGKKPDLRSALYSLGCTLHEALTGQPPFVGTDPKKVLQAHLQAPVPDIGSRAPSVPPSLTEVVRELLEKDPDLRIQGADELVRRLKQSLLGAGVAVPKTSAPAAPPPRPAQKPLSLDEELGLDSASKPAPRAAPARAAAPAPRAPTTAPRLPAAAARPTPARSGATRVGAAHSAPGSRPGTPRPAAAAGRAPHAGPPRAPSRLQGPARGREHATELDEDLEEDRARAPRQGRSFPITIGGAILGVLIGGFVFYKKSEESDARLKAHYQKAREELVREEHKKRKDIFHSEVAGEVKEVQNALTRGKANPPGGRQDALLASMKQLAGHSTAPAIASEIAKSWTPPQPKHSEDVQEEDKAYEERKAAAEALHAEGKYGEAVQKLLEDSHLVQKRHGKEIDELQKKYEDALNARWREDEIKYQRLASAGEADKAIEILRGAIHYADASLRKDIEQAIDKIQRQVAVQSGAGDAESGDDDASAEQASADNAGDDKGAKADTPSEEEFSDPDDPGGKPEDGGKKKASGEAEEE